MLMDSLARYGLTPSVLQVLIIAGVFLVVIGMYWHYIVAGAAVLFTIFVFCSGNTGVVDASQPVDPVVAVRPVKPVEPVETEQQKWHRQFLEDCTNLAENSKETCENIWSDRMMDESHLEVNPDADIQPAKYIKHRKVRYD